MRQRAISSPGKCIEVHEIENINQLNGPGKEIILFRDTEKRNKINNWYARDIQIRGYRPPFGE